MMENWEQDADLRRLDHPSGYWQIPQGGIDDNEKPEEAYLARNDGRRLGPIMLIYIKFLHNGLIMKFQRTIFKTPSMGKNLYWSDSKMVYFLILLRMMKT